MRSELKTLGVIFGYFTLLIQSFLALGMFINMVLKFYRSNMIAEGLNLRRVLFFLRNSNNFMSYDRKTGGT